MKKRFLIPTLFASLLMVACGSDDDNNDPLPPPDAGKTVEEILNLSYSTLTPAEQKVKLEAEASELLKYGDAAKKSVAIEAYQNFERLLYTASIDLVSGVSKSTVKSVKETVQYADVYGVYTWNSTKKNWDKTASTSELKFLFPAKRNGTSNNAVFTVTATSSGIPVTVVNYTGYWDEVQSKWVDEETHTTYDLPSKAQGLLTVGGTQAGIVNLTADYQNNKEVPVKTNFSVELSDGYKLTASWDKGATNKAESQMTFGNTVLFNAAASANIKMDEIFDKIVADIDVPHSLFGSEADGYIKILGNLVMVVKVDAANLTKELDALYDDYDQKRETLWNISYNEVVHEDGLKYHENTNKDYFTLQNQNRKEYLEKHAAIYNKYQTIILASGKDGAKVADIVQKSELEDSYTSKYSYFDEGLGYWEGGSTPPAGALFEKQEYYTENWYLKFNDNTLAEVDTYFSTGFSSFTSKWEEFVKAFNR